MIPFVVAALLAAAQAAATPAASPQDAPSDSAVDLATIQQLYDESCGSRGYGAYDDLCITLTEQLHQAQRAAAHHPRARSPPAKTASPVPTPPARATLPPDKPMEEPSQTQSAPHSSTPSSDPAGHGASTSPTTGERPQS